MREHKKSHLGIMGWAMFLAGAMSLGSCSSDETLESMEPKAITFGSVSMENHSRAAADPSYGQTTNPLDQFKVWGTVTGNAGTANIFNGATVTNDYVNDGTKNYGYGQVWSCNQTQYWIPSATYNFMAIANATNVTTDAGIPTAINYTVNGTSDLLLGELATNGIKTVTTDASGNPSQNPVAFTMTHLLSKVHFTFDGSATNVAKIEVTGHYGSGTYTIGTATWNSLQAATTALSFGGINGTTSANARLIIPGEQTWTIKLYDSSNAQIGNDITLNKATATGTNETGGFTFAPNTQYNINISLGVELSLTVAVQAWEGVTIQNNFADNVTVDRGDEIEWIAGEPTITENQVVLNPLKNNSATFKFRIAGPMGGTWHAMLVTQQGNPNAFTLSKTQGEVGEEYEITISAGANASTANVAELRFVVRSGGKILPVDNLTYFSEDNPLNGTNYVIVQNPTIN